MSTDSIVSLLGGRRVLGGKIASALDMDAAIRRGFSLASLEHFKRELELTNEGVAFLTGSSEKTVERWFKRGNRITPAASDRLYRVAKIVALAGEVHQRPSAGARLAALTAAWLSDRVPFRVARDRGGLDRGGNPAQTDAVRLLRLKVAWRIADARFGGAPLSGEGGLYAAGRWHYQGRRVVYFSRTLSLAALEVFACISSARMPRSRSWSSGSTFPIVFKLTLFTDRSYRLTGARSHRHPLLGQSAPLGWILLQLP